MQIKKIVVIWSLLVLFTCNITAQKVEITPQYGYQIGAKYNYYGGYLKFHDSDQYGLTLGVNAAEVYCSSTLVVA